ncbi:MAG: response regulator transcription factor [Dermatophilaceae bacterium]|nr:response regulator transcription factor [Intrasporangiaceae bacterium]
MSSRTTLEKHPHQASSSLSPRIDLGTSDDGDMYTVLVVEDEREIRELLRRYLTRAGLSVLVAATGAEALLKLEEVRPDLVLLDLGLPDVDGTEILESAVPSTPVIVLTARAGLPDRIAGLRAGADDYVVKPFSPTEVVLRVQAVLARRGPSGPEAFRSFDGGRLRVDQQRHEASLDGVTLSLTPSEWTLLVTLTGAPGRVFSRHELVERIGGSTFEGYERTVDSHVKNLRHKLAPHAQHVVETVVGFGYRSGVRPDG